MRPRRRARARTTSAIAGSSHRPFPSAELLTGRGQAAPPGNPRLSLLDMIAAPLPSVLLLPAGVSMVEPGVTVTLRHAPGCPVLPREQAMLAVYASGIPWGLGASYQGYPITVTAWYGLITVGEWARTGGRWHGPRNIPLANGALLDRIEDRPMWLIDYGSPLAPLPYASAWPAGLADNHLVCAVDAATRTIVRIWSYRAA